jgi:hypothetical protein
VTDDKISLVNDESQIKIARNHFENKKINFEKEKKAKIYIENYADPVTFKTQPKEKHFEDMLYSKNEQLSKMVETLERKNFELEEKLMDRNNEVMRLNNTIEQLTEDYGKLTAKHNALLIYASDLQKKIDIYQIELVEKRDEVLSFKKSEWGKLLAEKDKMLKLVENELTFFKKEVGNLKSRTNTNSSNLRTDFNNMLDTHLLDNYLQENKKLKRLVFYN